MTEQLPQSHIVWSPLILVPLAILLLAVVSGAVWRLNAAPGSWSDRLSNLHWVAMEQLK